MSSYNIYNLDDDSLRLIFLHLDIDDKLNVEMCSKRFRCVSLNSWSNIKSINILQTIPFPYTSDREEKLKNISRVMVILKRCGKYLEKLDIDVHSISIYENCHHIFNLIVLYCSKVNSLKIRGSYKSSDKNLIILLKSFEIINISIIYFEITGSIFSYLKSNLIKEISIDSCVFSDKLSFYNFLTKVKNLNKFTIQGDYQVNRIIDSLLKSDCEELFEISLDCRIGYKQSIESIPSLHNNPDNLLIFLSKQKKLNKLELKKLGINNDKIIACLQTEHLEYLIMDGFLDECFIGNFKNLKILNGNYGWINHFELYELSKLHKLKKIEISFEEFELNPNLTYNLENYFKNLTQLETFSVTADDDFFYDSNNRKNCIDILLIELSICNNLKNLHINYCDFQNLLKIDIKSFSKLENLTFSHVFLSNEDFCYFIENLSNLKILTLKNCPKVDKNLIKKAENIKQERKDNFILNLNCIDCNICPAEIKNEYKLIKLTDIDSTGWPEN